MTTTDVVEVVGVTIAALGMVSGFVAWFTRKIWSGAKQTTLWDQRITHFEGVVTALTQAVETKLDRVAEELSQMRAIFAKVEAQVEVLWDERKRKAP